MVRFYSPLDEDRKRFQKKIKRIDHTKKVLVVLGIIVGAYIAGTLFYFLFTLFKVDFFLKVKQNEFRVGYPIHFQWDISNLPSQAFLICKSLSYHPAKF